MDSFALKIEDLDGMTVGRLRELLAGMADENTFELDRSYFVTDHGDTVEDSSELVIEDPIEDDGFADDCDRLFDATVTRLEGDD